RLESAVLMLQRRFQPPLHVEEDPPLACVWCETARRTSEWSSESKNDRRSRSITQSYRQHRSRHTRTASSAERRGRYPYESEWKHGSTPRSRYRRTTVCATLSATVGTPST